MKFEPKKAKSQRCWGVAFNFDEWSCTINNEPPKEMPKGVRRILIEVEIED